MKNPPLKPAVLPGYKAVWVDPVFSRDWRVDRETGFSFWVRSRIRRGHWRRVVISFKAKAARDAGRLWEPVTGYMAELQEQYDLDGMDPIYRYHRETDQVRSLSSPLKDSLHGLVWGRSFGSQIPTGTFQALRVWYIVKDMNLDRFYLYGRTAQDDRLIFSTPKAALARKLSLEKAIMDEYEEKAYMEFVRFVGWTVYGKSKALKRHRKFRKLSKERAFDFNERRWSFRRVPSRWERGEAKKAMRGVSGFHPVLQADYGGSYSKFKLALGRLSKATRRTVYEQLAWAVAKMEKALDKKRKARKPGKWRE